MVFIVAEKKESAASSFLKSTLFKIIIGSTLLILPILLFFLIPGYKVEDGFKTLGEIEKYAAHFDEKKISMENTNLDKPEYTVFYKSQKLGFFGAKLKTLGLSSGLPWTVHSYKNLLEKAIELAKPKNFSGVFALKIATTPASKVVVWGDVQGAFHSLSRDLRELVKLGIIDENLKISNPDYYFVFMGDVISRSAFIMETVSVVARLILNNPENVFYLRGNHESNNYWNGKGLERELKLRARILDKSAETPLEKLTNDFFDTLPALVYAGILPNDTTQFIRISHEGADGDGKIAEINDGKLSPFLSTKLTGKIASFNYKDIKEGVAAGPIEIKAIVKAEIKRKTYQAMDGLRLTSPENGVTAWTMLSCPTETYQKGLEYFFDAFSIIQAGAKIDDWTITLHSQDVRTLSGFKTRQHNLISGQIMGGDQVAPTAQSQPVIPSAPVQTPAPTPATAPAVVPQPQAATPAQQSTSPVAATQAAVVVQAVPTPQAIPTPATPSPAVATLAAQTPPQAPASGQPVATVAQVPAQQPAAVQVSAPVAQSVPASATAAPQVSTQSQTPVEAASAVTTPTPPPTIPATQSAPQVTTPALEAQNPSLTPQSTNPVSVADAVPVQTVPLQPTVVQGPPVAPSVPTAQAVPPVPLATTQPVAEVPVTQTPAPVVVQAQPVTVATLQPVAQTPPATVAPLAPASGVQVVPISQTTPVAVTPQSPVVAAAPVQSPTPAQSQVPAPAAPAQGTGEITFKPYKAG